MFRLPIHLWNLLVRLSAAERIRPSVYAERVLIEHLDGKNPTVKTEGPKPFLGKFDASHLEEPSGDS